MSKLDDILTGGVPVEMNNLGANQPVPERHMENFVYEDTRQAQMASGAGMQMTPHPTMVAPNPTMVAPNPPVETYRDPRAVAPTYGTGYVEQKAPVANYGVNPHMPTGMGVGTPVSNTGMNVNRTGQSIHSTINNPIAANPISPYSAPIDTMTDKGLMNSSFNAIELRKDECINLGIAAQGEKVLKLNYKTLAVEPLVIPEIRDTNGFLSDRVNDAEQLLGLSVIPFECLGISDRVVELQRHSISYFGGVKVVSGTEKFVNQIKVDEFINACYNRLARGIVIQPTLNILATVNGKQYMLPRFNEHEMQYLVGKLANFRPSIVLVGDSQEYLIFEDGNYVNYSQPAYVQELEGSVLSNY